MVAVGLMTIAGRKAAAGGGLGDMLRLRRNRSVSLFDVATRTNFQEIGACPRAERDRAFDFSPVTRPRNTETRLRARSIVLVELA
jgi:hypothetical protein